MRTTTARRRSVLRRLRHHDCAVTGGAAPDYPPSSSVNKPSAQPDKNGAWRYTGVKWSFFDIYKGRFYQIFISSLILTLALALIVSIGWLAIDSEGYFRILLNIYNWLGSFSGEYGGNATLSWSLAAFAIFAVFSVFGIILSIPIAVILMTITNEKESHYAPTVQSRVAHDRQKKFNWHMVYSIVLGFIIAIVVFSVLINGVCVLIANLVIALDTGVDNAFSTGNLSAYNEYSSTGFMRAVYALLSVFIAEFIIRFINRVLAKGTNANADLIFNMNSGACDEVLPEKYRNKVAKRKITKLLEIGAASSLKGCYAILKLAAWRDYFYARNASFSAWFNQLIATLTIGTSGKILTALSEAAEEVANETNAPQLEAPSFATHDENGKKLKLTKEQKREQREYKKQQKASSAGFKLLPKVITVCVTFAVLFGLTWWEYHVLGNLENQIEFSDGIVSEAVDINGDVIDGFVVISGTITNNSSDIATVVFSAHPSDNSSVALEGAGLLSEGNSWVNDDYFSMSAQNLRVGETRSFSYIVKAIENLNTDSTVNFTYDWATKGEATTTSNSVLSTPGQFTVRTGTARDDGNGNWYMTGTITNNMSGRVITSAQPCIMVYDYSGRPVCNLVEDTCETHNIKPSLWLDSSSREWVSDFKELAPGETETFRVDFSQFDLDGDGKYDLDFYFDSDFFSPLYVLYTYEISQ